MDWNPRFTWSGQDKFKTIFIPIIHNNLCAGPNGLRPSRHGKMGGSSWVRVGLIGLWVKRVILS